MTKNKIVPLILFLLLSCNYLHSQNKINVTGRIIDSLEKTPVDYCSIALMDQQTGKVINGTISDSKGRFTIPVEKPGIYKLKAEFIGYLSASKENITIAKSHVDLGDFLLQRSVKALQAVTIMGAKPIVENKIDKLVYNTANDLTAQGGVALDVLKKVPMVSVDIDGNVELQGNNNIRFLINGKPSSIFGASLVDALQSIPASQIKSIEVITSPGAKYDASGTGGIINIILKDSKVEGINSSINLSAGSRLENGSFNFNARKGNLGAGLFFSGNEQLTTTTKNTANRTAYSDTRDTTYQLFQQASSPFTRSGYQSGINFNWNITHKVELTASLGYNHFANHGTSFTTQDQQSLLSTGGVLSDVMNTRNSDSRFNENSTEWSVDYKKSFKKEGQELDLLYTSSFGMTTNSASQVTDFPNGSYPSSGIRANNPGKDHETDISIDYTQPVSKGFTIETGAKLIVENLNNNVLTDTLLNDGDYIKNDGQTYSFNYKRNIYAGYLSTSFSFFHDFLLGKAGLRYERTITNADFAGSSIPGYNIFAPSFVVQHKLDETQSFKFAYGYRIERPDYGDLNPFFNISDPHNISTGNPLLKPEIGHNFEVGYNKTFKNGGNIYIAGHYRYNTNDIQSLSTYYTVFTINGTDYTDVSLTQRYNIGSQTNVGINIFGSVPAAKKLNLRTNIDLGERTNSTPGLGTVSGFTYRINLNTSYQFEHNLMAEIFGNYRSSQKNIQGTRPAFFFYNLAIRKQFLNKNASIGITAANPFSRNISQRSTAFGSNFNQTNVRLVPFQSFGITVSYKFGKLQFKKNNNDDTNAPDQPSL